MKTDSRYLVGAIVAAILIESYLTSIEPYIRIGGTPSLSAMFFAIAGIHLLYKAIDLTRGERASTKAPPMLDLIFTLTLLAELGLFLRIQRIFNERPLHAAEPIYYLMMAITAFDILYQLFAICRYRSTEGDANGTQSMAAFPTMLSALVFKEDLIIEHRTDRSRVFLYMHIAIFVIFLLGLFVGPCGKLVAMILGLWIFTSGWIVHQRSQA